MGESSSSVSLYSRSERSSMRPPRSEIEPVSSAVSIAMRAASSSATSVISVSVSAAAVVSGARRGGVRAMFSPVARFGGLRRFGQRGVGVLGHLRRREQDEPHENDHHAERGGQDQVAVLVVHDGPMSSGPKS
jgi:hypothetical protein